MYNCIIYCAILFHNSLHDKLNSIDTTNTDSLKLLPIFSFSSPSPYRILHLVLLLTLSLSPSISNFPFRSLYNNGYINMKKMTIVQCFQSFVSTDYIDEARCDIESTPWSTCSTTCGMGVSLRVTNDNANCQPVQQRRLCLVRPCGLTDQHMVIYFNIFLWQV